MQQWTLNTWHIYHVSFVSPPPITHSTAVTLTVAYRHVLSLVYVHESLCFNSVSLIYHLHLFYNYSIFRINHLFILSQRRNSLKKCLSITIPYSPPLPSALPIPSTKISSSHVPALPTRKIVSPPSPIPPSFSILPVPPSPTRRTILIPSLPRC